jgi:hypothetical protein
VLSGQWTGRHDLSEQDRERVIACTQAFLATARPSMFAGRRSIDLDDEIQRDRERRRDVAS